MRSTLPLRLVSVIRTAARRSRAAAVLVGLLAGPLLAQETMSVTPERRTEVTPRRVRLVVSGGMTVPTGGFSTYHELGASASASAVIQVAGQKLHLRPEVVVSRFDVAEQKVRDLVNGATPARLADPAMAALARSPQRRGGRGPAGPLAYASAQSVTLPKLPDLDKLRNGAISSLLGTFANIEIPLGPRAVQPYLIGGVGAVSFRTDVTTLGEALDGVQWGLNAGAGVRFRLGPIGAGVEARFHDIPVDESKTFFQNVSSIPVTFSVVF